MVLGGQPPGRVGRRRFFIEPPSGAALFVSIAECQQLGLSSTACRAIDLTGGRSKGSGSRHSSDSSTRFGYRSTAFCFHRGACCGFIDLNATDRDGTPASHDELPFTEKLRSHLSACFPFGAARGPARSVQPCHGRRSGFQFIGSRGRRVAFSDSEPVESPPYEVQPERIRVHRAPG